ncbi:MAG: ABC transporter ATP-binding protein [Pseudomonadales bacterium]
MTEPAIRITNVSKSYKLYPRNQDRLKEALHPFGKKYHQLFFALRELNLEIAKGEIVGVVGRNGSGKSTLLKLISSVLTPSSGDVTVNGNVSALLELGSGFNPEFTGIQNIHFYATILGLTRREIADRFDAIVAFADLGEFIHQPLKTYSSGMKSRLGFAVAAHIDPEILILDEVLAVGDLVFKRKCYAKMEELFRSGKTIVYVSHDANSINQLCTRAILLDAGQIIMDGPPKQVTAYYQKFMFASPAGADAVRREIEAIAAGGAVGNAADPDDSPRYLEGLRSDARIEYRNKDVEISGEKIVDTRGRRVNVLSFGETYAFEVEVRFGIPATDVSFGFELKDIKGVLLTSVESAQLYRLGKSYAEVSASARFRLRYEFVCRLTAGTYLANFGVSSYSGKQEVLNRVVDVYMFKVENHAQYSAGYVQLVENVEVASREETGFVPVIRSYRPVGDA